MSLSCSVPVFFFSILALTIVLPCSSARPAIVNGSFETVDFNGWTLIQRGFSLHG